MGVTNIINKREKGTVPMEVQYINPFLDSAKLVLEQIIQVSPDRGALEIREVSFVDKSIWIKIGVTGEAKGHVLFGFHEDVALKLVSAMMGGFTVTQMDEMSKSAISELGNMISGNASTILYNQGVMIDITPPQVISNPNQFSFSGKALTVPLELGEIGQIDIQVLILK
jgi:chemotaxis protein CheX